MTCHVPCSQSREGGVKEGGWGSTVVLGARKTIAAIGFEVSVMAYESNWLGKEREAELQDHVVVELQRLEEAV